MIYPQSFALKVFKNIKVIGESSCLAMCYIYCSGFPLDTAQYVLEVSNAIDLHILGSDCTVLDAGDFLHHLTGKRYSVIKKEYKDISEIIDPTPVRFEYNGKGHWVVVAEGKIVFNPLLNSQCVQKGKLAHNPKDPNSRVIKVY